VPALALLGFVLPLCGSGPVWLRSFLVPARSGYLYVLLLVAPQRIPVAVELERLVPLNEHLPAFVIALFLPASQSLQACIVHVIQPDQVDMCLSLETEGFQLVGQYRQTQEAGSSFKVYIGTSASGLVCNSHVEMCPGVNYLQNRQTDSEEDAL